MKKMFISILFIIISLTAMAFDFGFGGPNIYFIPSSQVFKPYSDLSTGDGIISFGGGGMGSVSISNNIFMGGEGSSGYYKSGDIKYNIDSGAFLVGWNYEILNLFGLEFGTGIGGSTYRLSKTFNSSSVNTSFEDFIGGSSPYVNSVSLDTMDLSAYAGFYVHTIDFMAFFIRGKYNFSIPVSGWYLDTSDQIKDPTKSYFYYYSLSAGIMFGY